jgi:hypothetical protein
MMATATLALPLACDGCFKGYPAILSTILIVALLVGSIYVLLASNLGARVGYLVTMVSLFAFIMIMSVLWLIGAPGTTTGTGPRGREPAWVPFLPDSEVARLDFPSAVGSFPDEWEEIGTIYPGKIDSAGELERVRSEVTRALANLAVVNETKGTESSDWTFRLPGPALTEAERAIPVGTVRYRFESSRLLFGVTIPATDVHREQTVFAYRDKGLVYLYALYFFLASLAGFVSHMWLLARNERKQEREDRELEAETVTAGV